MCALVLVHEQTVSKYVEVKTTGYGAEVEDSWLEPVLDAEDSLDEDEAQAGEDCC